MRGTNALLPGGGFDIDQLLAPEQALIAYFARAELAVPGIERVPLADAFDRVLAERVRADADYPAGPRSTMDGFAVASQATPGSLRIAGELRMGQMWPHALEPGTALRIPTGGLLPAGADAIVPFENTRIEGESVSIAAALPPTDCVYPQGGDMRAGEVILEPGRFIGAPEVGVLATLGVVDVPVYRRPVFAIISSGDELVDPAQVPQAGQVRDSNRWAVAAALQSLGAGALHIPTVKDEAGTYERALREALERADGVVLTGGSSVGERDLTPQVIDRMGKPGVIVYGLRVKPGKPTVLAACNGKPIIGLPGNPTSALTILMAVAAPIVGELVGALRRLERVQGFLAEPIQKRGGWTWFVPVRIDETDAVPRIRPLALHSGSVSLLARADGFATFDETVSSLPAGADVSATRF
ncbi:MAG: molybdopterin molybdotransferase MoeA [Vulcanimicrobiaceae bacterium]